MRLRFLSSNPNKIAETPEIKEIQASAVTAAMAKQQQARYEEASAEADRLREIESRLLAALRRHGLQSDVQTAIDGRGLTVSLVSRHVVFANDLLQLHPKVDVILDLGAAEKVPKARFDAQP